MKIFDIKKKVFDADWKFIQLQLLLACHSFFHLFFRCRTNQDHSSSSELGCHNRTEPGFALWGVQWFISESQVQVVFQWENNWFQQAGALWDDWKGMLAVVVMSQVLDPFQLLWKKDEQGTCFIIFASICVSITTCGLYTTLYKNMSVKVKVKNQIMKPGSMTDCKCPWLHKYVYSVCWITLSDAALRSPGI